MRRECNVTRIAHLGSMRQRYVRVRLQVRLRRQGSRGYGDECFKIQLEIVVSAWGANVSSMARDSAGNPI
jgi:hypothetical protein